MTTGDGVRRDTLITAAVLLLAAFAIRGAQFGNPLIAVDENFYLLVGDRMLHGALPYVDIWDRKPIGLFLIYAAIRLLGGGGIVEYQVVATLFAAATAVVIALIARRIATPLAAAAAGVLYLLLIGLAGGMGGQSPVFYNLFVAGAALTVLAATSAPSTRLRRRGVAAMALVGIAMQIKYTAVFEGVFLGGVLLYAAWRQRPGMRSVASSAALWIGAALLPTLAALAYYASRGETAAFVYANFVSIGERGAEPAALLIDRLAATGRVLALPLLCVSLSVGLKPWRRCDGGVYAFGFVMAWLGAALAGYFIFGTYFDHYALPLMVPIAVACAPVFSYRRYHLGLVAAGMMLSAGAVAAALAVDHSQARRGGDKAMTAMLAAIRPRLTNCLYVYDGDAILYYLLPSCIPTRYPFSSHLVLMREAKAIGIDPLAEIRHMFALRPSIVVDTVASNENEENPAANALARGFLRRDYRRVAVVPRRSLTTLIYQRITPGPTKIRGDRAPPDRQLQTSPS